MVTTVKSNNPYEEQTSTQKSETVLKESGELDEIENLGEINDEIEISTPNTEICKKFCKNQNQLCNKFGECIEKFYDDSKAEANTNVALLAYAIIGLVCIVTALGFILYKVYKFK